MWFLDDIYKIGHCDMVLLSALAVLDQIDFHKVEAYDNTESQTEKVRNVNVSRYTKVRIGIIEVKVNLFQKHLFLHQ